MHLLLIHQNFPGQFRELAPAWLAAGHKITAIGSPETPPQEEKWRGLQYLSYGFTHGDLNHAQSPSALDRGQAVGELCRLVAHTDHPPDIVLVHSGWGEALMLRQSVGNIPIVAYPELWTTPSALGLGFDTDISESPFIQPTHFSLLQTQLERQNLITELAITQADVAVLPTRSQRETFPNELQHKLWIAPDGVDTENLQPDPEASFNLDEIGFFRRGDPIVTLVSRQLEPLRGLRALLHAWPQVSSENPEAHLFLVGGVDQGYGLETPQMASHLDDALASLPTENVHEKIHILGRLPYKDMVRLLQCSACHIGLSYPYTLSWSLLEAMSCAVPVITNDGSPLAPYIRQRENGLLVPFNDTDALVQAIGHLLNKPDEAKAIGLRGRETVEEEFSINIALKHYDTLFQRLVANH